VPHNNSYNVDAAVHALHVGDTAAVGFYIAKLDSYALEINTWYAGRTLLHMLAASDDFLPLCEALIDKSPDVHVVDADGNTTLHIAAKQGASRVADLLIAQGLRTNAINHEKETPMLLAVMAGSVDIVEALLLEEAQYPDDEISEMMLSRDHPNNLGLTPLHLSVSRNLYIIAKRLLEAGAFIDVRDVSGRTPWHVAASCGDVAMISLLRVSDPNMNALDRRWHTALHIAGARNHVHVVRSILKDNPNYQIRDLKGYTPLHAMIVQGADAAAKVLIRHAPNLLFARIGSDGPTAIEFGILEAAKPGISARVSGKMAIVETMMRYACALHKNGQVFTFSDKFLFELQCTSPERYKKILACFPENPQGLAAIFYMQLQYMLEEREAIVACYAEETEAQIAAESMIALDATPSPDISEIVEIEPERAEMKIEMESLVGSLDEVDSIETDSLDAPLSENASVMPEVEEAHALPLKTRCRRSLSSRIMAGVGLSLVGVVAVAPVLVGYMGAGILSQLEVSSPLRQMDRASSFFVRTFRVRVLDRVHHQPLLGRVRIADGPMPAQRCPTETVSLRSSLPTVRTVQNSEEGVVCCFRPR